MAHFHDERRSRVSLSWGTHVNWNHTNWNHGKIGRTSGRLDETMVNNDQLPNEKEPITWYLRV